MKRKIKTKNVRIKMSRYDVQILKQKAARLGVEFPTFLHLILHGAAQS